VSNGVAPSVRAANEGSTRESSGLGCEGGGGAVAQLASVIAKTPTM
jgi:hypothetical protein